MLALPFWSSFFPNIAPMRRWYAILSAALLWAQEADLEALWQERDNPEKARAAIAILEKDLSQNPHQTEKVVRLSRLYYLVGESLPAKGPGSEEKLSYYDKAFQTCRSELAYQLGLSGSKVEDEAIVKAATKDHLPLLYWAAAGIARWGKHAPFAKKVAARSKIRLYWDRVMELDPTYFHGGAYRFFGGYYALVPPITGEQDVNKSREMFEKAVATAPYYLETKVLYAEAYAAHPKVRDRELFRKLLQEVLSADPGTDPDYAAENRLAQKKAQNLLSQENELFE
jgi:hypothetical protein